MTAPTNLPAQAQAAPAAGKGQLLARFAEQWAVADMKLFAILKNTALKQPNKRN